ncbi:hypothetical protein SPSE_0146 [Staphylococcus pseudintermedius ED99]|nr:hypothetical protein SPSE_0146 [Staphylococcus pseudintermedius ED99]
MINTIKSIVFILINSLCVLLFILFVHGDALPKPPSFSE